MHNHTICALLILDDKIELGVSNSLTQWGDFIEIIKFKGLYGPLSPYSRIQMFIQTIENVAKFSKQFGAVPSGKNKPIKNTYYHKRNTSN